MSPKRKETQNNTFEQSYSRLEDIVRKLEDSSDEIKLEEVIEYYKEGLSLVKTCRKMLTEAELKIKKIKQEGS